MTRKNALRVLHVSPVFYPALFWGGPIFSTKAICDNVHGKCICIEVLTTDSAGPSRSQRLPKGAGSDLPYRVTYFRRIAGSSVSLSLLFRLFSSIANADVVHLTATFNFPTLPTLLIAKLLDRPVVWSPRGAIQATVDWPNSPNKKVKKMFLAVARLLSPRKLVLHGTAPMEVNYNARFFPRAASALVPNSVDLPVELGLPVGGIGLRLMFLSRLHPKKGLDVLFEAMHLLPKEVTLDVYGDGEIRHETNIRELAKSLGDRVVFHGYLEDSDKAKAFACCDVFVLPSHSENFGIVVAEALAHGLPVVTTRTTPWGILEEHGVGRCIDLTARELSDAILQMSKKDRREVSEGARALVEKHYSHAAMAQKFDALYLDLANKEGS